MDRPWVLRNNSFSVRTRPYSLRDVTTELHKLVCDAGVAEGLCTVFLTHTSASLIIQENADPDVLGDLARFMSGLVPESAPYKHATEGADDMPAHIRSALTQTSLGIPVMAGRLALGTWQAVYLWEHRATAHERQLIVNIMGTR